STTTVASVPANGGPNVNTIVWTRVKTPSGRYSVEMPEPVQSNTYTETSGGTAITMSILFTGRGSWQTSNDGILTLDADISGGRYIGHLTDEQIHSALDQLIAGVLTNQRGKVTGSSRETSPFGPATRFTGTFYNGQNVIEGWATITFCPL